MSREKKEEENPLEKKLNFFIEQVQILKKENDELKENSKKQSENEKIKIMMREISDLKIELDKKEAEIAKGLASKEKLDYLADKVKTLTSENNFLKEKKVNLKKQKAMVLENKELKDEVTRLKKERATIGVRQIKKLLDERRLNKSAFYNIKRVNDSYTKFLNSDTDILTRLIRWKNGVGAQYKIKI